MLRLSALSLLLASCIAQGSPELIVLNARVWTADARRPEAEAIAVEGGRFVFVGTSEQARAMADEGTRVIDAGGARVVPGLIDAHAHIVGAAHDRATLDLRDAASREDLLTRLSRHAAAMGRDAWVVASAWSSESWPDQRRPTAEEIDRAVSGRRAILTRMDGHMLLASTAALREAGITREGPADPSGGRIGREADGAPTGEVFDEAMNLFAGLTPLPGEEETRRLLGEALREAASMGITQFGAIESRRDIERIIAPMAREGALPARISATVSEPFTTVDEWRDTIHWAAGAGEIAPNVRVIGFKAYMDGSLGSRTAWLTEPYLDDPRHADNCGIPLSLAADGSLPELIAFGAATGLQPSVHAIGDRANHTLLDWYGALPEATRSRVRPRIEHAQHLLPEDVSRFAALGVVASMQPLHKADDGRYAEQRLGAERIRSSYAFRDLLDSGATLAFGSDWPVVSCDPFLGIWAATSARTLDGRTFVPEQSISVEEALAAYTRGASYALHSEGETGMIREGRLADFAVLSGDPFGEVDLRGIASVLTVVGGAVTWEAQAEP